MPGNVSAVNKRNAESEPNSDEVMAISSEAEDRAATSGEGEEDRRSVSGSERYIFIVIDSVEWIQQCNNDTQRNDDNLVLKNDVKRRLHSSGTGNGIKSKQNSF